MSDRADDRRVRRLASPEQLERRRPMRQSSGLSPALASARRQWLLDRRPASMMTTTGAESYGGSNSVRYRGTICRAVATLLGFCAMMPGLQAAEPTLLHVNTFPTARSLPFYVGVDRGFFARHGLNVALEFTESSERQRERLGSGAVDIVQSGADNTAALI